MRILGILTLLFLLAMPIFAQGGKAEPKRIMFAAGQTSAAVTGALRTSQEMDFVFAGRKGQRITIRNPKYTAFDFRIFDPESGFDTEFDSSPTLSFELEADGDHLFIVRRKVGRGARSERFSMTLTIK